ncbi:hypothetical protein ACMFMG_001030 [Clarireedia jacksonii]
MSRQPPPSAGLPPRPPASRREMGDSYRPDQSRQNDTYVPHNANRDRDVMYQFGGYRAYPPPPPPSYGSYAPGTEPPRGPATDSYRSRPSRDDSYRPQERDFDFRYDAPPSIDFQNADRFRPRSPPRNRNRDNGRDNRRNVRGDNRAGGRNNYRGRGGPRLASDRDFLKGKRSPTPELMPGMTDDNGKDVRYRPLDELSDSDEAEMDMSDDDGEQPKKKMARTDNKTADGDSAPKWSNPDPYTALPPPDETQQKKKDVVKLIRKARVTSTSDTPTKASAAADDFISFDFDNDPAEQSADEDDYEPPPFEAVDRAPKHTQSRFSHLDNIRKHDSPQEPHALNVQQVQDIINQTTNGQQQNALNTPQKKITKALDISSDPSLGSRKRTANDEIKPPPRVTKVIPGKPPAVNGSLLKEWRCISSTDGTPWLQDHSDTSNMGLWLHKEIMDFYHHVKPRKFEQVIRTKLVDDLRNTFRKRYRDADIHSFGSFPAGLYLPTSDVDLVLVSDEYMRGGYPVYGAKNAVRRCADFVKSQRLNLDTVEVITGAKVPLVKYVDKITGLKVDMSFENDTGLIANKTFQEWKAQYPAMPILVTIVKQLLAMRGLNEPVNGGIGGFSVTCLVVSLLQNMPQIQSGTMVPEHHLGEVLMEFFDLYGNQFNTLTTAISLNPPGYISKAANREVVYRNLNQPKFSIIDPNRSDNDIAGGSSNTRAIQACFSAAYDALQKRMGELQYSDLEARRNQSILGCILEGNYSSFKLQREHLAHLHETLIGPCEDL